MTADATARKPTSLLGPYKPARLEPTSSFNKWPTSICRSKASVRPFIVLNSQIYNTMFEIHVTGDQNARGPRPMSIEPLEWSVMSKLPQQDALGCLPANHRKTPVTHLCNWHFRYFFVLGYATSDLEISAVFVNQFPTHRSGLPGNLAPNVLQALCTPGTFLCVNLRNFSALFLTRSIHGTDS